MLLARSILGVLTVLLGASSVLPAQDQQVARLAKLGEVWFKTKYFHPYLACQNVAWDRALAEAIPKTKAARSAEQFARAVQGMLDVLKDPVTHVSSPLNQGAGATRRFLNIQKREDGVWVVSIARERIIPAWQQARNEFINLQGSIQEAKAVVFDFRLPEDLPSHRYTVNSAIEFLGRSLIDQMLITPGFRSRVYEGWPPTNFIYSTIYRTSFEVAAGMPVSPAVADAAGMATRLKLVRMPMAFVLNRYSPFPPFAAAAQSAGLAAVVFAGEGHPHDATDVHHVELEGNWRAEVRMDEMIFSDGRGARPPTERVSEEAALKRAFALLRVPPVDPAGTGVRCMVPVWWDAGSHRGRPEYPPPEDRIRAAIQIWGVFEFFYPYRHLIKSDWNKTLREFIVRFEQARDAQEYHLAVAEMTARVGDAHTRVPFSRILDAAFGNASPAVAVRIVEGQPLVTAASPAAGGVAVGDIIRTVDGEDVQSRLKRLARYFSAPTEQSMRQQMGAALLRGPAGSVSVLDLEGEDGKVRKVHLPRGSSPRLSTPPSEPVRILEGNVGYVLTGYVGPADVEAMFEKLRETKAIIFDLRRGGAHALIGMILPRLTDREEVVLGGYRDIIVKSAKRSDPGDGRALIGTSRLPKTDRPRYRGRTVVLTNENMTSQVEGLAAGFRAAAGSTLIGGATTGSNGDTTNFSVPGGIFISFTGAEATYAGQGQQQQVGVQPDLLVEPTIAGIRAGRDEVLERALEYLQSGR